LRLATLIFTAFIPMFAFISGAINNDNAAVTFSTIGLWWALRLMRLGDLSLRSALIAGLIVALGALSKSSAIGLLGLFGFAALLSLTTHQSPFTKKLFTLTSWCLTLLLIFALLAGWWFVRNLNLYGDLLGWNAFLDVVGRRDPPATLAQLWTEREGFVWAYWGVFGTLNVIMPPWVYSALNSIVIIAMLGWLRHATSGLRGASCVGHRAISNVPNARSNTQNATRITLLCIFWVILLFVSLLRWTSLTPASQGRLMFPCITVIAAFIAYGLWRVHRFVLLAGCVFLMGLAVAIPLTVIAPTYARPSNTWQRRLSTPINATFNAAFANALQLVEAESQVPDEPLRPGDEATLALNWKLIAPLPTNYSVFVHLVNEYNVIVAQRDMYPGQGNLALSELPAGYAWTDRYTLRLSPLQLSSTLKWRVGLYNKDTGERLKLADGSEFVEFGRIKLLRRLSEDAALLRYTNNAQLISYNVQPRTAQPGDVLTVTLNWGAANISGDYAISVQVLDDGANKIGSRDMPLTNAPSEVYGIPINADASPGVYRLLLVIYRPSDFARVGAYDSRGQFAGDQIELTRLRIGLPKK
jgi:4-amino-4-deoxy-L-arabinose transferase-like glycosyltransferase